MKTGYAGVVAFMFTLTGSAVLFAPAAGANIKQMKAYKEAFPDAKIKCSVCHAVERPSKEGAHGLNAYGQAVVRINANPTAETFKKAGKAEDYSGK